MLILQTLNKTKKITKKVKITLDKVANMPDNEGRSRGETLERLKTGKPGRKGKDAGQIDEMLLRRNEQGRGGCFYRTRIWRESQGCVGKNSNKQNKNHDRKRLVTTKRPPELNPAKGEN